MSQRTALHQASGDAVKHAIETARRQYQRIRPTPTIQALRAVLRQHIYSVQGVRSTPAIQALRALLRFICFVCNKAKHSKDMREEIVGSGNFQCSGCAPNLWLFDCTVCHEVQRATDFRDLRDGMLKLEKQTIRRCQRCEICMSCKRHFEDFSNFETNAQYCRTCYKRLVASKKCRVCGKAKTHTVSSTMKEIRTRISSCGALVATFARHARNPKIFTRLTVYPQIVSNA